MRRTLRLRPRSDTRSSNPSEGWTEYIDSEWFYEAEPGPPRVEPWESLPDLYVLPVALLQRIAQHDHLSQLQTASHERETVAALVDDIQHNGLQKPLVLIIDRMGYLVLQDGHHRLLAAIEIGRPTLPVRLKRAERIKRRATAFYDLAEEILSCSC